MDNIILDAIIRANKLGRRNIMVIDYRYPSTAADRPELILVLADPPVENAIDTPWEDK